MRLTYSLSLLVILFSCKENDPQTFYLNGPSVIVVNGGDNSLSVIDPETQEYRGRIFISSPNNTFAHHIGINSDASKFAIALPEYDFSAGHNGLHGQQVKGYVAILNRLTEKVERSIEVPYANHNAVFSPDGTEVWTGLVSHTGKLLVYQTSNGSLVKDINVGSDPHEVLFSEDGKYVLVTGMETSFLSIIDPVKKELIRDVKVDPFPTNVWYGKDANQVIIENSNQNSLNFVDLSLKQGTDYIDLPFTPGFSKFAPNGELWICAKGQNFVYIYEKKDGHWNQKGSIATENDPHALMFLNGNTWLVNQKQNTVEIFNTTTKEKKKSINVGPKPNAIVYIP